MKWLLLALAVAGLAAADHEVMLPGTGLVISVPAGWVQRDDPHGAALAFRQPRGLAGLAAVVSEPTTLGPAGFAKQSLDELQAGCAGFAVLDSGFGYQMGAITWSHVRYRMRLGTVLFEQIAYLTVSEGRGVIITGSAPPEAMAALLPAFERAALTAGLSRPTLGK
jgi:hypothetical protein